MTSTSQQPWSFKGDYFEACNCEVNCACVFGSPGHYDDCQVALGVAHRQRKATVTWRWTG